ncbi:YrrS family protein [Mesobacillus persicus]|uniref:YrrS family protein n=1 Tax=Mesobacillus persicus TaxID=930146 RepID=UPI003138C0D3
MNEGVRILNNDFENEASRAQKLAKRRKTNLILNSLITVVLLLIVFVTVKIFFGDSQSEAEKANTSVVVNKEVADKDVNVDSGNSEEQTKEVVDETPEGETEAETEDQAHSDPIVTEGGDSPDVKQTIIDPNWQPVGTSQTGEHVAVYDDTSIDWQEMLQALSQASGIAVDDMTVWHLRNNGSPQKAVGTVSGKGGPVKYRVAIDWVDGQGWKPVKLEELKLEE